MHYWHNHQQQHQTMLIRLHLQASGLPYQQPLPSSFCTVWFRAVECILQPRQWLTVCQTTKKAPLPCYWFVWAQPTDVLLQWDMKKSLCRAFGKVFFFSCRKRQIRRKDSLSNTGCFHKDVTLSCCNHFVALRIELSWSQGWYAKDGRGEMWIFYIIEELS